MTVFGVQRGPRETVFGVGQRAAIGALTRRLGSKVLVCTDARLAADRVFAEIADDLKRSGLKVAVYDQTSAELPIQCVADCVTRAREFTPDAIIGIGGGSCLDAAKAASLLFTHGGRLQDYYGEFKVPGPVLPVVAVPTTSGTGSEVTPVAVVGDPERTLKVGISSPYLIPHTAICDPELTVTCPPKLTAIAGADALTHAIEAFTALVRPRTAALVHEHVFIGKHDLSDHHALRAIAVLGRSLRRAVTHGDDIAARADTMLGALEAGLAFGTAGTAAAHAVQYPVGASTSTAHGLGVAAMLPYVMEFNRPRCVPEFAQVAVALGVAGSESDPDRLADLAIDGVAQLFDAIGIPRTLADLGLPSDKQGWVAEQALSITRLVKNNPRQLDSQEMERLVRAAYVGDRTIVRDVAVIS